MQLSPLNIKHRFYFIYQLPSQLASFFRTSLQQKKEFIPTKSTQSVWLSHMQLQPFTYGFKQFIAIVMAQRVVDLFKIIPISKQK